MANTEGMTDEVLESLLGNPSSSSSSTTRTLSSAPTVRASTPSELSARQRRLQERMELPMGGKPAAKIIRASPKSLASSTSSTHNDTIDEDETMDTTRDKNTTTTTKTSDPSLVSSKGPVTPTPTPLVGSILERPIIERNGSRNNNYTAHNVSQFAGGKSKFKTSRFAQQHNMGNKTTALNVNGFPSVHVPLGTFVHKKKVIDSKQQQQPQAQQQQQQQYSPVPRPTNSAATTSPKLIPVSSTTIQKEAVALKSSGGTGATTSPDSTLLTSSTSTTITNKMKKKNQEEEEISKEIDASQQQAQAMITQMSSLEIQESIQELQTSLSPDMLSFLKRRGASKKQQQQQQQPPSNSIPVTTSSTSPRNIPVVTTTPNDLLHEKERLARLVSSVKSHEDLDSIYEAEQQQQHFLQKDQQNATSATNTTTTTTTGNETEQDLDTHKNTFDLACTLLRSTVPRQTLWAARVISMHLRERYTVHVNDRNSAGQGRPNPDQQEWPSILPVSLRCLLDQPPHQSNSGYLLHTYVLQSIYYLLCLNAYSDHIVAVEDKHKDPSSLFWTPTLCFQAYFLDDAVPTPRLGDCYPASEAPQPLTATKGDNANGEAMAYSTTSSSSSAEKDGDAFAKDPMWTLLSRMRIVPRIAQLLDWSSSSSSSLSHQDSSTCSRLPREALVAICGIFAMISQRSPGAASAIVHHSTLLPQLLDLTLLQLVRLHQDGSDDGIAVDEGEVVQLALPAVVLLCTLARQSKVTAGKLVPLVADDVLPAILSKQAPSNNGMMGLLQQWLLVLWRTMLRYGLGLSNLSTMINLSVRHLTLSQFQQDTTANTVEKGGTYNLATGFLSALGQVLECVHFARSKSPEQTRNRISPEVLQVMSLASTWLSSSKRLVLSQLASVSLASSKVNDLEEVKNESLQYRWKASQLRFLSSFWNLFLDHQETDSNTEIKVGDVSRDEEQICLDALLGWMGSGGLIERAWKTVSKYSGEIDPDMAKDDSTSTSSGDVCYFQREAAACALLDSAVSLLLTLEKTRVENQQADGDSRQVQETARTVLTQFLKLLLDGIHDSLTLMRCQAEGEGFFTRTNLPLAQRGWINQCHFAIAKFMFHCMSLGILTSSSDIGLVRMHIFSLLGRLGPGNESMAAVLCSQDRLFQGSNKPVLQEEGASSSAPSPISSMFLGELCGSDTARIQLDHSFKLQHGFGITSDGFGSFKLESLLSDSDQGPKRESPSSTEVALPLDKLWLWQTLSGAVQMKNHDVATGTKEAASVVSSCLELLLDLEEDADLLANDSGGEPSNGLGYAARIPVGAKLYYVINVCLHPESVLREENVVDPAEAVINRYLPHLDRQSAHDFALACLEHTEPAKKQQTSAKSSDQPDDEDLNDKEKKLLSMFLPEEAATTGSGGDITWSSQEMKAIEAFLEDLLSAYTDYGAQYSFFTKCMRLFLLPVFPSSIRCRVLHELRGMLHVLTLHPEVEEPTGKDMRFLVEQSISDGLAPCDYTHGCSPARDPAQILDAVTSILDGEGGGNQRSMQGYILSYSISLLIRSIAICCIDVQGSDKSPALIAAREAARKRILRLDGAIANLLLDATASFMVTDLTKQDLVDVVIRLEEPYSKALAESTGKKLDEDAVEQRLLEIERLSRKR